MRRALTLFALFLTLGAAPADAITVRDIVELSKSGLSDELLLALIDIEKKVFPVDPATLKTLKEAGVSERVILAMMRSGRTQPAPLPAPAPSPEGVVQEQPRAAAPPPQVVVIEHRQAPEPARTTVVREVVVPFPVYVPVYVSPGHPRPVPQQPIDAFVPRASIGLAHSRLGLSSPPPRPTSDPPYWK